MADPSTSHPLNPLSIRKTHARIQPYIHRAPLLTSHSLNTVASSPNPHAYLSADPPSVHAPLPTSTGPTKQDEPRFNLFFKLESTQKIGAFKSRGAFSALTHLANSPDHPELPGIGLDILRKRGVITHSSGNHAQALALAASTLGVPAWIVMPKISTPSKISGTRGFGGVEVVFSGSTSAERESVVREVVEREKLRGKESGREADGPVLVPPYDHPDIVLGQGTVGLEMEEQLVAIKRDEKRVVCSAAVERSSGVVITSTEARHGQKQERKQEDDEPRFDAVLTPLGGGGLLSGVATWFSHTADPSSKAKRTLVFGCEPSFSGANDAQIGLSKSPPERVPHVSTLTIADGLRTPVGLLPWTIISDKEKVSGVYSVSELEIKMALKLVLERMKVVIEPSSAVPLAVVLFCEEFREMVSRMQRERGVDVWDVGIVISGGNTTVEGLGRLFEEGWLEQDEDGERKVQKGDRKEGDGEFEKEREVGTVGADGKKVAEDVAG